MAKMEVSATETVAMLLLYHYTFHKISISGDFSIPNPANFFIK